jgi:hypothetical protein
MEKKSVMEGLLLFNYTCSSIGLAVKYICGPMVPACRYDTLAGYAGQDISIDVSCFPLVCTTPC